MQTDRILISVAAALLAVSPVALAQESPGQAQEGQQSKIEFKNRAPVSKEVLRVKLPKPTEVKLENGITVLIMEDHRFPVVSVEFNINGAGALFEPKGQPGLAIATAQMMREGTKARSSQQIAEDTGRLGANVMTGTAFGQGEATLAASGLAENFDQWFAIATDVLLNPSFPADELNRMRQRSKLALRQQRSSPAFLGLERFNKAVFGEHPASVVSMTAESLDALTPEALAKWHKERYTPQNTILGIAGDVTPATLVPKLKKALAAWEKTSLAVPMPPDPVKPTSNKVFLVDRAASVQTSLSLGNLVVDRHDPDYVPLTVMNRIVGGGSSARLFSNLREAHGYTYGAYSTMTPVAGRGRGAGPAARPGPYPGPWRAYADVRTEVTGGAMTEFFREIGRIRDEKVPEAELEQAKRSLVANFALSLEDPERLLNYAITQKTFGLPADYWDTYPTKVSLVTAEQVQSIARKYVDPANLQVVAVGDGAKIKPVLEKYGPVEVYDTEGKAK